MAVPTNADWIRNPSDELALAEGSRFDPARGELICEFLETFCVQSIDRWHGQPLTLMPWQRDFLMRLFSWRRPDARRRFESAYLEVAKKNGKSTMLAALTLALLIADGQATPQIYINAVDRGQASIIFDEAARMVAASPQLRNRLKIVNHTKRIVWPAGNGVLIANSGDAPNKDGFNPSAVLWDELHRQAGYELWDVFKYAGAARSEPLRIAITTAGEDETGPWFEQRDFSEKVNAGLIPNTTHLGVVHRCDPGDDLDDPEVWRKANPSLGVTIDPAKFRDEWSEAKSNPRELPNFKRLRFNIVCASAAAFMPLEEWDACQAPQRPDAFHDAPASGGLDLASTTDLTALVWIVGDEDEGYDVGARFYHPADDVLARERTDRVPYSAWAQAGHLTLTPGATTDYATVRRHVNELAGRRWSGVENRFEPTGKPGLRWIVIKADEWNALQLAQELRERDDVNVEFIRQGYQSLSAPTKELERLVRARKIRHDGNPVLRWCLSNAVAVTDDAGNVKLSKKRSRSRIDGAAALVNALAGRLPGGASPVATHDEHSLMLL